MHRAFFTFDDLHIASFSDDKTVALWDIASEKQLTSFNEHTDYIRAGAVSPVSTDILLSGGYDKFIHMYDARTNKKILSVNHDAPVESLLFLPTGGIFLSAGIILYMYIILTKSIFIKEKIFIYIINEYIFQNILINYII